MTTSDDDRDDEVGYGKPPKHTRFKKGQSGNPKGRPKGALGFKASVDRELASKVTVREGNKEIRLSKRNVAAKRFAEKLMKGDMCALKLFIQAEKESQNNLATAAETAAEINLHQTDEDILRDFLATGGKGLLDTDADNGEGQ